MRTFVGDALDRPVDGWISQMILNFYGLFGEMGQGIYADDTEMMIGMMESPIESPQFDPALTAKIFLANLRPS